MNAPPLFLVLIIITLICTIFFKSSRGGHGVRRISFSVLPADAEEACRARQAARERERYVKQTGFENRRDPHFRLLVETELFYHRRNMEKTPYPLSGNRAELRKFKAYCAHVNDLEKLLTSAQ